MKIMNKIVYLNGNYIPLSDAKVSVLDRGFLFGDGVYELIPYYDSKSVGFDIHLNRLQKSLDAIRIPLKVTEKHFDAIFTELLRQNNELSGAYSIYVQITRGASDDRNHAFPKSINPTIFAITKKITPIIYEALAKGKTAITREDIRWKHCYIKSISLLPNILLYQEAVDSGCDETILIRDGYAHEGTSSNIYIVKNNTIITPPLSEENLSGVTRDLILHLAASHNIPLREEKIPLKELYTADEVWISSSTRGIFPIVILDGKTIGNGKPGQVWEKIIRAYISSLA